MEKIFIISSTLRIGFGSTLDHVLKSFSILFNNKKYEIHFHYKNILYENNNLHLKGFLNYYSKKYNNINFIKNYNKFLDFINSDKNSTIIFYEAYDNFNGLDFINYRIIVLGNIFKLFSWSNNSGRGKLKLLKFKNLTNIGFGFFTKLEDLKLLNKQYFGENILSKEIFSIHTPYSIPYIIFDKKLYTTSYDILILLGAATDYSILDRFIEESNYSMCIIGKYDGKNIKLLNKKNIKYYGFISITNRKIISYLIQISKIIFVPLLVYQKEKNRSFYKNIDNEFIRWADSMMFGKIVFTSKTYISDLYPDTILIKYNCYKKLIDKIKKCFVDKSYEKKYSIVKKYFYSNICIGTIIGKVNNFLKDD